MSHALIEKHLAFHPVNGKIDEIAPEVDTEDRGRNVDPTDRLTAIELHDVGWVLIARNDLYQVTDLQASSLSFLRQHASSILSMS